MPRYDVFLEGRTESSTCYFGVAVMADDQKRQSTSDTKQGGRNTASVTKSRSSALCR